MVDQLTERPFPTRYERDALVVDTYFWILPLALQHKIKNRLETSGAFNPELWTIEEDLAKYASYDAAIMGFWDRAPIPMELLGSADVLLKPLTLSSAELREVLGTVAVPDLSAAREAFESQRRLDRAYCGWLTTNPAFVEEHDRLMKEWAVLVRRIGIPRSGPTMENVSIAAEQLTPIGSWAAVVRGDGIPWNGPPVPKSMKLDVETAHGDLRAYSLAFESFFKRWEIAQLVGPMVPLPLPSHWGSPNPNLIPGHAADDFTVVVQPHTMPIPGGDLLRQVLEDAAQDKPGHEHLAEWMELISKNNTGKQSMDRFARHFRLQHFWRVLHRRHGEECHQQKSNLMPAFADFLEVDEETIRKDLQRITERLGAGWYTRPAVM